MVGSHVTRKYMLVLKDDFLTSIYLQPYVKGDARFTDATTLECVTNPEPSLLGVSGKGAHFCRRLTKKMAANIGILHVVQQHLHCSMIGL